MGKRTKENISAVAASIPTFLELNTHCMHSVSLAAATGHDMGGLMQCVVLLLQGDQFIACLSDNINYFKNNELKLRNVIKVTYRYCR